MSFKAIGKSLSFTKEIIIMNIMAGQSRLQLMALSNIQD